MELNRLRTEFQHVTQDEDPFSGGDAVVERLNCREDTGWAGIISFINHSVRLLLHDSTASGVRLIGRETLSNFDRNDMRRNAEPIARTAASLQLKAGLAAPSSIPDAANKVDATMAMIFNVAAILCCRIPDSRLRGKGKTLQPSIDVVFYRLRIGNRADRT